MQVVDSSRLLPNHGSFNSCRRIFDGIVLCHGIGHTRVKVGKPVETVARDCERDYFMSADEAKEYGLIDKVIYKR